MADLNVDRYESLAARALGVKGPGALTKLEDGVFATLELDAQGPVELLPAQRIARYRAFTNQAGVGGQSTQLQLFNPVPDTLVVIERFNTVQSGATPFDLRISMDRGLAAGGLGGALGGLLSRALDGRLVPESLNGFAFAGTSAAVIPAGHLEIDRYKIGATTLPFEYPHVLQPGDSIVWADNTLGVGIIYSVDFHIRTTLPGEL